MNYFLDNEEKELFDQLLVIATLKDNHVYYDSEANKVIIEVRAGKKYLYLEDYFIFRFNEEQLEVNYKVDSRKFTKIYKTKQDKINAFNEIINLL